MRARRSAALAAALLCLSLTACAAPGPQRTSHRTTAPQAAVEPISTTRTLAAMPVPVTLEPPAGLPVVDLKPGLATWRAGTDAEDAIRVMEPVRIRSVDGPVADAPADLHAHLLRLTTHGARITDDRTISAGGPSGHLFTITSTRPIDAGVGCWSTTTDTCFGLPPELTLRMATFTVDGRSVVLWARMETAHPNAPLVATFERMLTTVRFQP